MENLLIIGETGLLGSAVKEVGKEHFDSIVGTYNTNAKQGLVKLDARDRKAVFELIKNVSPLLVVDTHALNNVDYCEQHPEEAWEINVNGTRNVAEASKLVGAKYVFISSDYVFSGSKTSYSEKDKPDPLNYYGKTKYAAELVLQALDINYIALRTSSLYGSRSSSDKKSFPFFIAEMLRSGKEVKVAYDQYVSPTNVDDLARVIFELAKVDAKGIFHATGPETITKYDFAQRIAKALGLNEKLIKPASSAELNFVAKRPGKVVLETTKLKRVAKVRLLSLDEKLPVIFKK
jgi:dTDP-4-dehydrorhamnose reductase